MITIQPEIEILSTESYEDMLRRIEKIGRVCYKSEERIGEGTAEKFIAGIIKRGHESVIEHGSITVKVTCDRGVTHEIVRHRIASYSQESTRYCNYSKDKFGNQITCIDLATDFPMIWTTRTTVKNTRYGRKQWKLQSSITSRCSNSEQSRRRQEAFFRTP